MRTTGKLATAFLIGSAVGALITLFMTPAPGTEMRGRLRRGAKAAQDEFSGVAFETREALGALAQDARQTLRRTATRLNAALGATKNAFSSAPHRPKG